MAKIGSPHLFFVLYMTILVQSKQNDSMQIDQLIDKIHQQPYYVIPEKSDSDKGELMNKVYKIQLLLCIQFNYKISISKCIRIKCFCL
jgi:hypothetical protein